ncbi:MAG: hypothetical protein KDK40_05140, partial [Chlamydiia bacterium]|nr:hypothetical protein [Chlamydiia bacterium]
VQHVVGDHVRWKVTGANLERIFLFWSKIGPEELAKNVISLSNLRICEIDLDFGLVLPPQDLKQSISCEIYPTDQSGHRVMKKSSCYEVNAASKSQTHADDSRYDDEINGKKVSISYEKRYLQSVPFYQKLRIGTVLAN